MLKRRAAYRRTWTGYKSQDCSVRPILASGTTIRWRRNVEDDDTLSSCGFSRTLADRGFRDAGVSGAIAPPADLLSCGEHRVRDPNREGLEHKRVQLRGICHQVLCRRILPRQVRASHSGIS